MDGIIASAVVLPEPQETNRSPSPPQSPTGQKRRQSSVAEQDAKRPRLNSFDAEASNGGQPSSNAQTQTTAVPARRERGRERRLFGAVLGALSQNFASPAQRKRSEIEKRQRAQREQEEQEDGQRKAERIAQRKAQRRIEQKRFERESMRIRHANMRHMAHFLRTKTEPQLYYKPWETTEEEDERIQAQIAEAEETIRRELDELRSRENADGDREQNQEQPRNTASESNKDAQPSLERDQDTYMHEDTAIENGTNERSLNGSGPSPEDSGPRDNEHAESVTNGAERGGQVAEPHHISATTSLGATSAEGNLEADTNKEAMDDNGDEMVEAAEDTVIY
ncbi:uncharacterized protein EI97DRAFT_449219 [Westerdykella ornata]|uniref:Pinin/SDK/MemA protein domain-containing protein n=1 Tax=Westerdykella ornata TaxID=318751 RepID=A0A6A6JNQ6_WESOR|nr:uncharacterized protein EI97DRAFT_449219 [Westerdykella ornata]KAF2277773.1 hypothetical protein EI97DRAFT_449219 [Westerdykella ornata]